MASVRQDPQTRAHWGLRAGPPQALRPPWAGGHLRRDDPGARPGHGLRLVPRGGTGGPGSPSVALPTGRPTCAPCSAPGTLLYPLVCPADHSKLGFLVESQRCSGREGDPKHSGFTFLTAEGVRGRGPHGQVPRRRSVGVPRPPGGSERGLSAAPSPTTTGGRGSARFSRTALWKVGVSSFPTRAVEPPGTALRAWRVPRGQVCNRAPRSPWSM